MAKEPVTNEAGARPRFCVLGAGHGGTAMAAHLALMGFQTNLFNRSEERLLPIKLMGGIELLRTEGDVVPHGTARLHCVTTDIAEALPDSDVLMVAVPATGHRFMAEACASHLRNGHIVVLNPGRTGGALEFSHILRRRGVTADVVVAEAQTFIYASRCVNPAQVQILRVKNSIPVAALPAYRTPEVVQALRPAFPQFAPGDNVIKTSLDNIGAVFHPTVTVLNAARIESTHGDFEYYIDGVTESVSRVLEALDAERVGVAAAMGFNAITARQWLYLAYDAAGKTLHQAMRANPGYYGIKGPYRLDHRYLNEDVPMSLVPIASLGDMLGVETPTIDAAIHLAGLLNGCDYWAEGRTVERLGLAGLSLKQIRELVLEGLPTVSGAPPTHDQA
ncbi:MAG TPA: NAD/NADP octopine/nopaline dehydrogenase family protein [Armatimonadota bacterium]|nr:NAD/NADP octopine/nopaline dehydrogenase family protein [Armatimonadota bacterium]